MKKSLRILGLLFIVLVTVTGYLYYPKLDIITGYAAKNEASIIYLAHRTQTSAENEDNNFSPINLASEEVNPIEKSVSASIFGLKKRTAVYREGLGAVLMIDGIKDSLKYEIPKRNFKMIPLPYPYGDLPQKDTVLSNIDYKKLDKIVDDYFVTQDETDKTRALLIIYKDKIIAEKYAKGFNKNTPILGWSMGKSVTSAVLGVLQKEGKINVNQTHLFPEWEKDVRSNVTLNNLLQMNSGLEWDEDYTKISDVTKMLFLEKDMTKSQLNKRLVGKPNESWNYSSGTTNLLSRFIRKQFKTHQEYLDFWYSALIDKIGMHSMELETDLSGNYVGSSYVWATPRDWAKFGLLYLHKGNWNGEQILNEDWVKYTTTPTNGSDGVYGAQFWLNAGGHLPDAPEDLFLADGYQGQRVFMIPSKDMVVVRMGITQSNLEELLKTRKIKKGENKGAVEFELNNISSNNLLKEILSAIK